MTPLRTGQCTGVTNILRNAHNCRCEVQNGVGELSKTIYLDVQGEERGGAEEGECYISTETKHSSTSETELLVLCIKIFISFTTNRAGVLNKIAGVVRRPQGGVSGY